MRRKRDETSSSTPTSTGDFIITTRKRRTKVQCFCSKCNGNLVDPKTKKAHEKKSTLESSISETHSPVIPPEETHHSPVIPPEETHHSPIIPPEETLHSPIIPPEETLIEPIIPPEETLTEPTIEQ